MLIVSKKITLFLIVLSTILTACSVGSALRPPVSQTIGPNGGTISNGIVTLTIPPQALTSGEKISIIHNNNGTFTFEPDGLVFNMPITVTSEIPLSDLRIDSFALNDSNTQLVFFSSLLSNDGSQETFFNIATPSSNGNTVIFNQEISHFSTWQPHVFTIATLLRADATSLAVGQSTRIVAGVDIIGPSKELLIDNFLSTLPRFSKFSLFLPELHFSTGNQSRLSLSVNPPITSPQTGTVVSEFVQELDTYSFFGDDVGREVIGNNSQWTYNLDRTPPILASRTVTCHDNGQVSVNLTVPNTVPPGVSAKFVFDPDSSVLDSIQRAARIQEFTFGASLTDSLTISCGNVSDDTGDGGDSDDDDDSNTTAACYQTGTYTADSDNCLLGSQIGLSVTDADDIQVGNALGNFSQQSGNLFQSDSMNITLFSQNNHACTMDCNDSDGQITIECTNLITLASCTSTYNAP